MNIEKTWISNRGSRSEGPEVFDVFNTCILISV